jgi:hypothetical protein
VGMINVGAGMTNVGAGMTNVGAGVTNVGAGMSNVGAGMVFFYTDHIDVPRKRICKNILPRPPPALPWPLPGCPSHDPLKEFTRGVCS